MRFPHKTIWAVFGISLLFMIYIGTLVAVNYRWAKMARQEEADFLQREVESSALVLEYFFDGLRNDLEAIAEEPGVSSYFTNKALGMSLAYGLGASLDMMAGRFHRLIRQNHVRGQAIYSRVVMLDNTGSVLVDTQTAAEGKDAVNRMVRIELESSMPGVFTLDGPSGPELVIGLPYYTKGEYSGKLVAWILSTTVQRFVGSFGTASHHRRYIDFGELHPADPLESPQRHVFRSIDENNDNIADASVPDQPGTGKRENREWLIARSNIAGTPFQIVAQRSVSTLSDRWGSWKIPFAMGILAVVFLSGSAAVLVLHTRKAVLQAHLEKESEGSRRLANMNRRLADEIRQRSRIESQLRREVFLNEALAEMAGAILARQEIGDVCGIVLQHALQITGSRNGYVGYIDPITGALVSPTLIGGIGDKCGMKHKQTVFESFSGLWGWVLNHRKPLLSNAPGSDPRSGGLPEGHTPIERFLSVPSQFEQMLVGQISVANTDIDYTDVDRIALERLSALFAIAVKRWRDEATLMEVNLELEKRVRSRTAQLEHLNRKLSEEIENRKQTEKARKSLERLMTRMVEAAPIGIFINDRDGRFHYVNPAFLGMFGYTRPDELVGKEAASLAVPEDRLILRKAKTYGGDDGKGFHHEGRGIKKSGEVFEAVLRGTVIENQGKKALLGFIVDVSEEKRLERHFHQAQKMEAVGRLAGGLAHDFNNLLTIIIGWAGQIDMGVGSNSQIQQYAMEIQAAGERAAALTRQLLSFSRKKTVKLECVCINDIVQEMDKMIRRIIGEDVTVATVLDPDLDSVRADRGQIEQAIMNLAVNARDAMPGGGRLSIATANTAPIEEISVAEGVRVNPGNYMVLSVSDTGMGMDEETRLKIFEPFFTTKGEREGTGLGLFTVYGIVKQHDGFINVSSKPEEGTTFNIYLPAHKGEKQNERPEIVIERPAGKGETVLVVEDEASILKLSRRILEDLGYTVLTADTPGQAMDLAIGHRGKIHLLVTDVVMPAMSGMDLAARLAARFPHLKILFMSGYAPDAIAHRGSPGNGFPFIGKPFSASELVTKVREVLDASNAAAG